MKLCVRQTVILFAASSAIINALPMPDFFSDISDEFTGFGFFGATDVANQAASWGQGIGDSIADFGAQAGFALKDGFNQDMEWAKTGMDYMDFGMKTASSYAGNAIGQGVGYTVDGGMLGSEGLLNGVGDSKDASNIENQRQGVVDLVTKETSKYATEAVMPVLGLVMAGGVLLGGPEMAPASIAELEAVGAGEAALLTADVAEGATAAAGAAEEGAAAAATGEGASAGVAGEGASAGSTTAVTGSGEVGATVGTTEGATTTGESVVTVGRSDVNIAAKGEDGSGAAGEFSATADEAGFNSGKIACSRLRRRTLPFAGCGQSLGIYRFDQPQHVLAPGESFLRTAPVDVSPTGASQPLYEQLTAAEETINNVAARRTRSAELQLIARQRSALTNDFSSGSNQVYQDFRFNPVSGDAASAYIPHSEPGSLFLEFRVDTTNFNNPARYLVEVRDEGASYTVINRYYTSNHYALNSWDSVNLVEPQGTSLSSASGREELFPVLGGKTI